MKNYRVGAKIEIVQGSVLFIVITAIFSLLLMRDPLYILIPGIMLGVPSLVILAFEGIMVLRKYKAKKGALKEGVVKELFHTESRYSRTQLYSLDILFTLENKTEAISRVYNITKEEYELLQRGDTIPIHVSGNCAAFIKEEVKEFYKKKKESIILYDTCPYCGTRLKEFENSCPNCGGTRRPEK